MKAEEYHQSLAPLEEACRIAGWACIRCPLTGGRFMILLRHLSLFFKIYKNRRRRILLREFSNLPLLLVFPLLWPLRKRIYFMIHHNLQWAVRDPLERFGLAMLARLGARWAIFETQDFQGLGKFRIPAEGNLVLPHPSLESPPVEGGPQGGVGPPLIGVAGYYRPEKGIDELIGLLNEECSEFGILLGVPNPEAAAHLNVETVSTASEEDYFRMISRCDVLVFNGREGSYLYRASGAVADAVACGTAVVAPDFPIIRSQVSGVGEVFKAIEDLPAAVRVTVAKMRAGTYDFKTVRSARSAQMLANQLGQFD